MLAQPRAAKRFDGYAQHSLVQRAARIVYNIAYQGPTYDSALR